MGQSQSQKKVSDAATNGREAQDHDLAGGIAGPSPRPEADDGAWSQDAEDYDDFDTPTQPMQGWYQEEDVIRFGAAVRDMLRGPDAPRQVYQAERGGR